MVRWLSSALRWIAVLPACVLSAVIVLFPIHWVVLIGTGLFSRTGLYEGQGCCSIWDIPPEALERGIDAVFVPATLIYTAAWVAPAGISAPRSLWPFS